MKDEGFINEQILQYLPILDRVNFMYTCKEFFRYYESSCETCFRGVDGFNYKGASEPLKKELRRLWKYFKSEMEYRNTINEQFSFSTFLLIIQVLEPVSGPRPSFFTDPKVLNLIKRDNLSKMDELIPGLHMASYNNQLTVPHFPEIFLTLFKLRPDDYQTKYCLLQNVLIHPYIFLNLFRYLKDNVYIVSRYYLIDNIVKEYPLLQNHEFLSLYESTQFGFNCYTYIESILSGYIFLQIFNPFICQLFSDVDRIYPNLYFLITFYVVCREIIRYENFVQFKKKRFRRWIAFCKFFGVR